MRSLARRLVKLEANASPEQTALELVSQAALQAMTDGELEQLNVWVLPNWWPLSAS